MTHTRMHKSIVSTIIVQCRKEILVKKLLTFSVVKTLQPIVERPWFQFAWVRYYNCFVRNDSLRRHLICITSGRMKWAVKQFVYEWIKVCLHFKNFQVICGRKKTLTAACTGTVRFTKEIFVPQSDMPLAKTVATFPRGALLYKTFINVVPPPEVGRFRLVESIWQTLFCEVLSVLVKIWQILNGAWRRYWKRITSYSLFI